MASPWPPPTRLPAQPYLPVGPVQPGKACHPSVSETAAGRMGEDTNPTETMKTMQPHKSPGIESVS